MRGTIEVMLPLCERPATNSTTIAKLISWRNRARKTTSSISFADLDSGPDSDHLLRELDWLLEDAVADPSCGWPRLKSLLQMPGPQQDLDDQQQLLLRSSFEDLDHAWLTQRLQQRRPFQYIVGCSHWRDMVVAVQEGVLIPRPETEQLVDLAASAMSKNGDLRQGCWADLGTGSGAIGIGIARALAGDGCVVAVDASDVAVAVAKGNVRRLKVEDSVSVVRGSWFSPLQDKVGQLCGVVSNPPYIPTRNLSTLQAEVGKHEPVCALDGGEQGIDHLVEICDGAACALKPGGFLALETDGGEQAHVVADLLSKKAFKDVKVVKDFADVDRFVTGFRMTT